MLNLFGRGTETDRGCRCETAFEGDRLVLDAANCPHDGQLATAPACRARVVGVLAERDAETVLVRTAGEERAYEGNAAALLVAAGRFAELVTFHDDALATHARRDPLGAAREATGRASSVARIAAETGLAELAARAEGYDDALRHAVGPAIADARIETAPPSAASLANQYELPTGATVRIYDAGADLRTYQLTPPELRLDDLSTLDAAYDRLVAPDGPDSPARAVRAVADDDAPVETLVATLSKHTRGWGVVADLFADPAVSDVFASAPVTRNPLRVRVDGEPMRTGIRLTEAGVAALCSGLRLASGRAFSRAAPTIDATLTVNERGAAASRRVRVAGVRPPVSDGPGFAFRAGDRTPLTLPALVANGTLTPEAAALLSLAVERGVAALVAGTRGAGKTTLLGALLWELPLAARTVVIEDTPELPIDALASHGRDTQALHVGDGSGELQPTAALRTALRLGEGALVVGEVRGEEARTLYEAMRVGASGSAVLGTIHGDGGATVRERVVSDLGVPESAFAATDLLVTCHARERPGGRSHRVTSIEEVTGDETVAFAPLYEHESGLVPTGRLARGESHLLEALVEDGETYADVRTALAERSDDIERLARTERTTPADVVAAVADRASGC